MKPSFDMFLDLTPENNAMEFYTKELDDMALEKCQLIQLVIAKDAID